MQKWEYKIIIRRRTNQEVADNFNKRVAVSVKCFQASNWSNWAEDGKPLPTPVDIQRKLTELGCQGWELVSVMSRSDMASCTDGTFGAHDLAGFTSSELWVFKRPASAGTPPPIPQG